MRRVLLAMVAALALAACSSSDQGGPSGPLGALADAPDALRDVGTLAFTITGSLDLGEAAGGAFELSGSGVADLHARRSSLTMDLGASVPGGPLQAIQDGTITYLAGGPLGAALPAGVAWVRIDPATFDDRLGIDLAGLSQLDRSTDPTAGLEALRGVADDIEEVGSEDVRGVETTHYRATVSLDRAVAAAPAEALDDLVALREQAGMPETYPVDVWVDADGLVRRLTMALTQEVAGSGPLTQRITTEFHDLGDPVEITVPPDDEVVDLADLLG